MHESVLLHEVLDLLAVREGGGYIDATVGGGGHAEAMLDRIGPDGFLLALDRDDEALGRARERLKGRGNCRFAHARFGELGAAAGALGIGNVDGIVMDIGVSSDQLDCPDRGFSFMADGPLDMRMDRTQGRTAAAWVAEASEGELASLFRTLGEERQARRLAAAIGRERAEAPIETTGRLAGVIERAVPRRGRLHPATRVFQALRMAVNDELGELAAGLEAAIALLKPGGRLAVIAFHSLEDRLVKRCFAGHAGRWESLQQGGAVWHGMEPRARLVSRKVIKPTAEEVARNPRARSARLRVLERMERKD